MPGTVHVGQEVHAVLAEDAHGIGQVIALLLTEHQAKRMVRALAEVGTKAWVSPVVFGELDQIKNLGEGYEKLYAIQRNRMRAIYDQNK